MASVVHIKPIPHSRPIEGNRTPSVTELFREHLEEFVKNQTDSGTCVKRCVEICEKVLAGSNDKLNDGLYFKCAFSLKVNSDKRLSGGKSEEVVRCFSRSLKEYLDKEWTGSMVKQFLPVLIAQNEDEKLKAMKAWGANFREGLSFWLNWDNRGMTDASVDLVLGRVRTAFSAFAADSPKQFMEDPGSASIQEVELIKLSVLNDLLSANNAQVVTLHSKTVDKLMNTIAAVLIVTHRYKGNLKTADISKLWRRSLGENSETEIKPLVNAYVKLVTSHQL